MNLIHLMNLINGNVLVVEVGSWKELRRRGNMLGEPLKDVQDTQIADIY